MIRYLRNSQINYPKWDACVESAPQRLVYALSWYLDVVSPGWAGLVEEQDGRYIAVMPLPVKRQFGIHYLQQPFFCQQLGFFSETGTELHEIFLAKITRQFQLISQYSFNTHNTRFFSPEDIQHVKFFTHHTHHLNLNRSYEDIYQHYSHDRKTNLKRSRKAGLLITESADIEPLIRLFKEDAASRIRGGVSAIAYGQLRKLYKVLAAKGLATLLYTQTPTGETDAGCFFLIYGQKIIYLFNAASVAGRRRNGRSLMIDFMIRKYAGQPYIFDFESPAAVASIIRVYQGFGAAPAPFYTITYNKLPAPVKFLKKARQLIYQKVMATFVPKPRS